MNESDRALFRKALFAPTEAEKPIEAQLFHEERLCTEKYREGANLLQFIMRREQAWERREERLGKEIFAEWRDGYLLAILKAQRFILHHAQHSLARAWAAMYPDRPPRKPPFSGPDSPTLRELTAAGLILVAAPEDVQDRYLWADADLRATIEQAVIRDGGLYDASGRWLELPWTP